MQQETEERDNNGSTAAGEVREQSAEEVKEKETLNELKMLEKEFLEKANDRERIILEQL